MDAQFFSVGDGWYGQSVSVWSIVIPVPVYCLMMSSLLIARMYVFMWSEPMMLADITYEHDDDDDDDI